MNLHLALKQQANRQSLRAIKHLTYAAKKGNQA